MSNTGLRINASRVNASIQSLKQYLNEEDITSVISVLEAIVQDPEDDTLIKQLSEEVHKLGILQGSVLTYAPYVAIILSEAPFDHAGING